LPSADSFCLKETPAAAVEIEGGKNLVTTETKTTTSEGAKRATILLVDDSIAFRLRLRKTLTAAGFDVLEAVDGLDALEKLSASRSVGGGGGDHRSDEISLVVCDVNMPRMNGVELIEELARRCAEQSPPAPLLPFLMLTSEGRLDLIRRAREVGAKAWMFKPFDAADLVHSIRKIVTSAPASAPSNEVRRAAAS
jgi:two-component system, chemotaxis family, chemotaxis protein CheY